MSPRFARRRTMPPPFIAVLLLPLGMSSGFISVTLGYVLAQHGVSVAVIAGLVGLRLLPETWSFLSGPLIDSTLSSARWYVLSVIALAITLAAFALVPFEASSAAVLGLLCLATGLTGVVSASAAVSAVALTTSNEVRGACAGWRQTGNLGGMGLGGGAGLWLVIHGGGTGVAALAVAAICLTCVWPFLFVEVPTTQQGAGIPTAARAAFGALWKLLLSRTGALAIIAVTLPAGVGAWANLLPAVADDWHASADQVALVTGALSAVANIPGCILGGYLCDRFARRGVLMCSALVCALGESAMALAPHTPLMFTALSLSNCVLTGVAYGSVTAVIYDRLGAIGGATVGTVLSSLCNVPLVLVTMLIGAVQVRHGSSAMLLTEALLSAAAAATYVLIVIAWRPASDPKLLVEAPTTA